MKITPLFNKILIEVKEKKEKSIVIDPGQQKDRPTIGKVLEVGSDVKKVKKGNTILFAEYGFEPFEVEGKEYQIGTEENVLAVLE